MGVHGQGACAQQVHMGTGHVHVGCVLAAHWCTVSVYWEDKCAQRIGRVHVPGGCALMAHLQAVRRGTFAVSRGLLRAFSLPTLLAWHVLQSLKH